MWQLNKKHKIMKATLVIDNGSWKRYIYRGYVIERSSNSCWLVWYDGEVVEHSTSLSRCKHLVDWRINFGSDI